MHHSDWKSVLDVFVPAAQEYLGSLPERRVYPLGLYAQIRADLDHPLTERGVDPAQVVAELARDLGPYVTAHAGGRFFGFVIGGLHPASWGAELLVSTWDQNAGLFPPTPGVAVAEELAAQWLIDLLHLPAESSVGFVTGGQMANFTCLAAARDEVLRQAGWDVEADGLIGAPPITVIVGSETHATIPTALQFLGLGRTRVVTVDSDGQGRMRLDELAVALPPTDGPTIVILQAGNVNTGSSDPLGPAIDLVRARCSTAWVHVDGAFGLWAAASPTRRGLIDGHANADSWATDGHKWLNVPYDSGYAFVRDPAAHAAAMSPATAAYIAYGETERDEFRWVPEYSRRARGFATYAALRSLGRSGVADLVDRCCTLAERMADALRRAGPGVEVLNDVVLDQVLVRFHLDDGGDADVRTREVIARVQADGTCWLGGTTWQGKAAMRISVINWSTTEADIDRSAAAILAAASG